MNDERDRAQDENYSQSQLGVGVADDNAHDPDGHKHDADEQLKQRSWSAQWRSLPFDRRIELGITVSICVATVIYAIFSIGLWSETRELATQARVQAEAAQRAADAANAAAVSAKDANTLANQGIKQNLDNARLDQRAWISISGFKFDKEPTAGTAFKVTVVVANTGKTPAVQMASKSRVYVGIEEKTPPIWSEMHDERPAVLFPTATSGTGFSFDTGTFTLDQPRVSSYEQRQLWLGIWAFVKYDDVFGGHHWTQACAFHLHGEPVTSFSYCPYGNEIDREK